MRAQCVLAALCCLAFNPTQASDKATPLVIGETFTLQSKVLSETRRINVYLPPGYAEAPAARFPVLYMPDGGLAEDFLHVAGLVQVSVGNGTMRPFVLVGIENTQRRRDLTGPTQSEEDRKIAPRVGGSAEFRRFLRDELMPDVQARYRTTDEKAIVGESLAGLFVVETFLLEPDLFDSYIAIDPSLWWNDGALMKSAAERLGTQRYANKWLWFASSSEERGDGCERLFALLQSGTSQPGMLWRFERFPEEKHSTIYHPAALMAFRAVLGPR
jgi:uncharacterized protein